MSESIDRHEGATMDAIEGLVTGEMSRDDFIKRLTVLGFSASAIGGMLAAAGKAGEWDGEHPVAVDRGRPGGGGRAAHGPTTTR